MDTTAVSHEDAFIKAGTLTEALPWIRRFQGSIFVIKLGGNAMADDTLLNGFADAMVFLATVGVKPVVVRAFLRISFYWLKLNSILCVSELEAYSGVVTALRAQGDLTKERRKVLQDLSTLLNVSVDRHKAEVRRAVNDELLHTIATT